MSAAFIFMAMVALAATTEARATETNTFRVEEIRAAERAVIAALESPDPTAWVYMYTEDAVFLESGGPVSGRRGLLDMAKAMKPLSSVTITPERTVGHGDLAYVYCTASWVNGWPPDGGTTSKVRGVMIWRKQADGRWLWRWRFSCLKRRASSTDFSAFPAPDRMRQ